MKKLPETHETEKEGGGCPAAPCSPELKYSDIERFLERLIREPRGHRRAANAIRFIACELAKQEACEDLANAAKDCQDMLVRAWENRWERERANDKHSEPAGENQSKP